MNSLAEAIKLRAVGVDTWSGHFADGRTIKQYMFADDECGLSLDMISARDEIFLACVWAVIHGHRAIDWGIDGINKTAVGAAVEFDPADGSPRTRPVLSKKVCLLDGREVPYFSLEDAWSRIRLFGLAHAHGQQRLLRISTRQKKLTLGWLLVEHRRPRFGDG